MDYAEYLDRFFTTPPPEPRFGFAGLHGLTLYFADYPAALEFYERVFGPPAYSEGAGTRGWQMGATWLTLLRGQAGSPKQVEAMLAMQAPAEVDRLHAAWLAAGGSGEAPRDTLMYEPVRACSLTDPFGTVFLIYCPTGS